MISESLVPPDYDLTFCSLPPPLQTPLPHPLSFTRFLFSPFYTTGIAFRSLCFIFSEIYPGVPVKSGKRETPKLRKDGTFQAMRQTWGRHRKKEPFLHCDLLHCSRVIHPEPLWGQIVFPCLKFQFN